MLLRVMLLSAFVCSTLSLETGATRAAELLHDPKSVRGGLVVSVDPVASEIGARVLERGGNAVDAAVAVGFALAVTYPRAGNIGGGGFMVVRMAKGPRAFMVDYREKAPAAAKADLFLDEDGKLDQAKATLGWLAVGVPGTPMGLWLAHQEAGNLPWEQLVDPAIKLAQEGFVVDDVVARGLASQRQIFDQMGEPAKVYFPDGEPPKAGTRLKLPELAESLRRIRDEGPAGFYTGRTAELLASAMKSNGGIMTTEDLASYKAVLRDPVRGTYRGFDILSVAPPSSGGTVITEVLNILEGRDVKAMGPTSAERYHLLAEAMKRAYYDRAKHLGDPDHSDIPVDRLTSKEHAELLHKSINARATPSDTLGADILTKSESEETTHFSVIDAEGNAVSNTYTLEGNYGAKVIAPGTGFLLNNEMGDFNRKPGLTNRSGLIGTSPNLIAPGKRMLSSQSPTIVLKDGNPFLVIGSPGGRTIPNTVLQVIANVIDHDMEIQAAIDAPRIHHQWQPDLLYLEKGVPESTAEALREKGHRVGRRGSQGDCHAIFVDPKTGAYVPGIDRRIRGSAVGF
ncbi:gamma-glutamyltransferase [Kolteria novifilia]|uniref:gamma-glutamyltransferase n=1 Tax=Kolteria novifilia TaxID=2527975 RepID=UPI003AF3CED6